MSAHAFLERRSVAAASLRRWLAVVLALGIGGWSDAPAAELSAANQSYDAQDVYAFSGPDGVVNLTNQPVDARYRPFVTNAASSGRRGERARKLVTARLPPSADIRRWVDDAARTHRVEAALVYAVMAVESGFDGRAVSPKGARGLMQLRPATAAQYGASDLFDPRQNIFAGASHLRAMLDMFHDDKALALAAYNAGAAAVARYGNRVPPYPETVAYVPSVLDRYQSLLPLLEATAR